MILVNRLKKARVWLGRKSPSQLATYLKFIKHLYEEDPVDITYDETLALFKSLAEVAASPNVDIMRIMDDDENLPPAHIQMDAEAAPLESYSRE